VALYDHEVHGSRVARPPLRLQLPLPPSTPVRAPTFVQLDELLEELQRPRAGTGSPRASWHVRVALVMRYTGLRVGQVVRLRWEDVRFEERTLVIRGELGKTRAERRGRVVPLSEHLLEAMAGWGVRQGDLFPPSLVRLRSDRPEAAEMTWAHVENSVRLGMRKAWARTSVPPEIWTGRPDHAFRKALRTELIARGAAPWAVDRLLGHAGRSTGDLEYTAEWGVQEALREAVALIPAVGRAAPEGVATLPLRRDGSG
jgi:integrase